MLESNALGQAKAGLSILTLCLAGCGQVAAANFDEPQVKASVEEAAVLLVCPDQTLLEVVEVDVADCRAHIAKLAPICWHLIDPLVADYEIEQGENGKDRFVSITAVYASCVRSELLGQIVKSRRESHAP